MKKIILAIVVFICGLAIAHFFFGIDVEKLFEGFADFLTFLVRGQK